MALAGGLPVVVHNTPHPTGNTLAPAALLALAGEPNIAGFIERGDDFDQFAETLRLARGRHAILAGRDAHACPALRAGAGGLCSTAAGVVPRQFVELYAACRANDSARAEAVRERVQALLYHLEDEAGGRPAACKAALACLGLPAGPARRPLPALDDEEVTASRAALAGLAPSTGA